METEVEFMTLILTYIELFIRGRSPEGKCPEGNVRGNVRTLEPDRISVSAPKLPNFLVSAWFRLRP